MPILLALMCLLPGPFAFILKSQVFLCLPYLRSQPPHLLRVHRLTLIFHILLYLLKNLRSRPSNDVIFGYASVAQLHSIVEITRSRSPKGWHVRGV